MHHIAIATGTRADWGLLLPLAQRLRDEGADVRVVATNAHLIPGLGHTLDEIAADGFQPDACLPTPGPGSADICAQATQKFADYFRQRCPDCVVVLGDRFEMLGVASAALLCGVPLVHIAGGTVSEGAFDNQIRNAISSMASLHLPETERCRDRLLAMGVNPESAVTSGALGVFNTMSVVPMKHSELEESIGQTLPVRFILATMHAETATGCSPHNQMKDFISGLRCVMTEQPDLGVLFTYPNNDVDPQPQIRLIHDFANEMPGRVAVVASLGRVRYISAVRLALGVAGNSSSGIVEVTSTGTPALDVGRRQQGREHGEGVIHAECTPEDVARGIRELVSPHMQQIANTARNPYYLPDTPAIMADAIISYLSDRTSADSNPDSSVQADGHVMPRTLFLITARGGSKGIPGKNIKPFCGKPLICHTIDHAREAGADDADICVSTDSAEIAGVCRRHGLEVPFIRPAELATDTSTSYDVIIHALDFYASRGINYDRVVLLQPTSPLRTPADIAGACSLWRPDIDMVVSVTEAATNPYYNAFESDADGFLRISKGPGTYTRRQDAPHVVEYNGAVYVMTSRSLRKGPISSFRRIVPFHMEAARSVDIDTPRDWSAAETIYSSSTAANPNQENQ